MNVGRQVFAVQLINAIVAARVALGFDDGLRAFDIGFGREGVARGFHRIDEQIHRAILHEHGARGLRRTLISDIHDLIAIDQHLHGPAHIGIVPWRDGRVELHLAGARIWPSVGQIVKPSDYVGVLETHCLERTEGYGLRRIHLVGDHELGAVFLAARFQEDHAQRLWQVFKTGLCAPPIIIAIPDRGWWQWNPACKALCRLVG